MDITLCRHSRENVLDKYCLINQVDDSKWIIQLIGGYIDIILKKKRIVDSGGIEGDEGATMVEVKYKKDNI